MARSCEERARRRRREDEIARSVLAPLSCSWGWFVERSSKRLVDDDFGTEASAKTEGEMPRRGEMSCELWRRLAGVSVKGALPAG